MKLEIRQQGDKKESNLKTSKAFTKKNSVKVKDINRIGLKRQY